MSADEDNDLRHRLAALEDEVQSLRNDGGATSTRRMMLKGGVAALGLGALATPSSAGTNQAGSIGGENATLDLWTEDLYIVEQGSTPSPPPSGYIDIYAKTDGNFYKLQSDGTESQLGGGGLSAGEDFDGQGTSDFTNLASVSTDDLDIGGSDLLSSGDFAAIGPTLAWQKTQQTSTSSTSYVTVDQNEANVIWDNWEPSGATTAVLSMFRVSGGTNADVRLNNPVNSEAVFEGNFADGESVTRTDTYTPTSASSRTLYQFEFRQPDGNSTILARAQATAGVQL
jgi:hypothetical protein